MKIILFTFLFFGIYVYLDSELFIPKEHTLDIKNCRILDGAGKEIMGEPKVSYNTFWKMNTDAVWINTNATQTVSGINCKQREFTR